MLTSQVKHWAKLLLKPEYKSAHLRRQELNRIGNIPRYTSTTTNILGTPIEILDSISFWYSYREIFEQEIYAFQTNHGQPIIIDGGSNIGLSVIYFKQRYPNSRIMAFEADPQVFKTLSKNINSFGYTDVQLINKAIWNAEGKLEFSSEGADAGRLSNHTESSESTESSEILESSKSSEQSESFEQSEKAKFQTSSQAIQKVAVDTTRLTQYLDQPIALLKLDIEGAETEVMLDCADSLDRVEQIFIEYHSFANQAQRLNELLAVLKKAGFRVQIHTQYASPRPFLEVPTQMGMDMQLNIFGYRDK
ncbi:methyltransferase FkbM family (plasmid) [Thalassoporum mexicanum PCC 7367]|uniref:FkbM family methyltransferase n=1 Tax=Thalassoporum mexicanum TaxID=3457544 RepID=UPI00029FD557|nr:FkbM family methyltransferase [Pseudanabaena sp. PCC 7367]AFY72035.1 methyltransferase FkbM family [Pseudanabaena sp. PCC 7367]